MFPALSKGRGSKYPISAALNLLTFSTKVLGTNAGIVEVFQCNRFMRFCKEFSCFSEVPAGSEFTSEAFDAYDINEPRSDN